MWFYEGKEVTSIDDLPEAYGFIYLIENLETGKKYIGRKFLTQAGYKQVKGKRKKIRKESDWKDYYGSSPALKEDIEKIGKSSFKRTIIRLCKTRGLCNYWETKEIFDRDALLRDDYYNSWISCKIQASHVKNLLIEGSL